MLKRPAFAALVLLAASAGTARAQCAFDMSTPNAGDVLRTAEPDMSIQFNVELELNDVRLLGPDNAPWPIDWTRGSAEVRETSFRPTKPLAPGRYMIEWNGYVRRHYHPDGGSISFTVASGDGDGAGISPAAAPPAPAAPRDAAAGPYRALLGARVPQTDR